MRNGCRSASRTPTRNLEFLLSLLQIKEKGKRHTQREKKVFGGASLERQQWTLFRFESFFETFAVLAFIIGRCKTRVKSFVAHTSILDFSISISGVGGRIFLVRISNMMNDVSLYENNSLWCFGLIHMHLFVMLDCIVFVHTVCSAPAFVRR